MYMYIYIYIRVYTCIYIYICKASASLLRGHAGRVFSVLVVIGISIRISI